MINEVSDIKPPIDPPALIWPWILLGVIVLGSIVFFLLKKWLEQKKTKPKLPLLPPWTKALAALEDLKRRGDFIAKRWVIVYPRLSEIVRVYCEDRYGYKAPEMTTEEFLQVIKESSHLNENQKKVLQEFLSACDLVKFAKYMPTTEEAENALASAVSFVEQTKGTVS